MVSGSRRLVISGSCEMSDSGDEGNSPYDMGPWFAASGKNIEEEVDVTAVGSIELSSGGVCEG
jgi:hypothetical protein